jgi:hypothetical protein
MAGTLAGIQTHDLLNEKKLQTCHHIIESSNDKGKVKVKLSLCLNEFDFIKS